jgi:hypothetical protein
MRSSHTLNTFVLSWSVPNDAKYILARHTHVADTSIFSHKTFSSLKMHRFFHGLVAFPELMRLSRRYASDAALFKCQHI